MQSGEGATYGGILRVLETTYVMFMNKKNRIEFCVKFSMSNHKKRRQLFCGAIRSTHGRSLSLNQTKTGTAATEKYTRTILCTLLVTGGKSLVFPRPFHAAHCSGGHTGARRRACGGAAGGSEQQLLRPSKAFSPAFISGR